ncbi:MAG TPA: ABC transporter ATP-binding protein [Chitinophaga sp.]|uniref:ABC transporter ATP-binding protein n=1 Tax=Chitinophaga sp. TaxID=1869181 RepID=UPI002CD1E8B3|nr:ABC transporter ATP-binding protein [Chitinophaga sp.]HVI49510.1 ABC transporter ATP-binding protein [Chitinophaga sp.]
MGFLSVSNVSKELNGATVLDNVSFSQEQFQHIAIAGETGSGKSTLMKIVGGLVQKDAGEVHFENVRVRGPLEVLIPGQPGTAYLSQHFELRNNYRVEEILSYANKLVDEDAEKVYEICQITHLLKRKTDQLSGGEKQRISLARLLTTAPRLLLLDEPFSNLDMIHKNTLKTVISDVSDDLKITCMLISHDPLDILSWADKILVMRNGKIVQEGSPEDIYLRPGDEYTAGLFGKYNRISPVRAPQLGLTGHVKDLFIRPEHFSVVAENTTGISGSVTKKTFFGSYEEIEVMLNDESIIVRTSDHNIATGDTVHLAVRSH